MFKTIYYDKPAFARDIELTSSIRKVTGDQTFPLIVDPNTSKEALFIGMFVLRSAESNWNTPLQSVEDMRSLYDIPKWIFALKSIHGGGTIANGNIMDAFRLGMQYGLCDAVMVGHGTAVSDGVPESAGEIGYTWLPENVAQWPHINAAVPDMLDIIADQRVAFQQQGVLSNRQYAAQTVMTDGVRTTPDLLEASIFHGKLPNGEPIEAYIVTSTTGANLIRERAHEFGLEQRIDEILIVVSKEDTPDELDLKSVPAVLYNQYDIKIVNHDGGAGALKACCEAGIIPQFNLTFARVKSLREVITLNTLIDDELKNEVLNNFDSECMTIFSNSEGKLPTEFKISQVIQDDVDEAVIAVLDARNALTM